MKKIFTAEDFQPYIARDGYKASEIAAMRANQKLQDSIEYIVFGKLQSGGSILWNTQHEGATHKLEGFIEELPRPECLHKPDYMRASEGSLIGKCSRCGVELIADWKVK